MKNKLRHLLSGPKAVGFILGLSSIHSQGAITLDSILATDGASSITTTISIDGSGTATASPDYTATGSVTLALGTSFSFTVDAVAVVNTTVGVNYGAKDTNGTIDRAANGDFGVQDTDGAGTVKTNGIDLNEGFLIGINASTLSTALAWKLTGIQLSLVNTPNEIFTIVNRSNTSLSITGTLPSSAATMVDVTSLNIFVQGGGIQPRRGICLHEFGHGRRAEFPRQRVQIGSNPGDLFRSVAGEFRCHRVVTPPASSLTRVSTPWEKNFASGMGKSRGGVRLMGFSDSAPLLEHVIGFSTHCRSSVLRVGMVGKRSGPLDGRSWNDRSNRRLTPDEIHSIIGRRACQIRLSLPKDLTM